MNYENQGCKSREQELSSTLISFFKNRFKNIFPSRNLSTQNEDF